MKTNIRQQNGSLVPFQVNRRRLVELFASAKVVNQLVAAGWIEVSQPGKPGRETLYDFASAKQAYERFKAGERPQVGHQHES